MNDYEEIRDEVAYATMPLGARFIIRLIVYLIAILYKKIRPYNLSPYFAIHEVELEEEEEEEEGPEHEYH